MTKAKTQTLMQTDNGEGDPKINCSTASASSFLPSYSRFSPQPLNDIEMKAVRSMIAYAAWKEGNTEEKICEFLLTAFGVTSLQTVPSSLYDDVLHFLMNPTVEISKGE